MAILMKADVSVKQGMRVMMVTILGSTASGFLASAKT